MKRGLRGDECYCDPDCLCHHHANPDARASVPDDAAALTAGEPQAIAFLRAYCAPDRWTGMVEGDDWQLFGSLHLSDLRNALAAFDAALLAARRGERALHDALDAIVKQWDAVLPQAEWHEVKAMVPVILAARQVLRAATPEEK